MNLKNQKGVSLVLVTVVLMVLTILACTLMQTVFQNYKISKASGYMDYSYYAGGSAIQKGCDLIRNKCDDESLASDAGIEYIGDKEDFSKKIVDQVLIPYIQSLNTGGSFKNMDVSGDSAAKADVKITAAYLSSRYDASGNPDKMFITLGITADSSYVVPLYVAGDKRVFAKKEFSVRLPQVFKLKGPIYSIGDLMADNSTLSVTGDVHIYGTSPEILSQPEQYYYGGIYAKNNAVMKINGNAYSRSFIRTGEYSPSPDNSSIHIYKDAIAQGIQDFGKNDSIVVMRNAYTFDDLELNGEDSIIAVNGSYFGLSNGADAKSHDDSSAIVNSAVIHNANSPDSQKSRIVVNGAVMVGGGTWRLDPVGGTSLYQIEDASVAWLQDSSGQGAAYKMYEGDPAVDAYMEWLKDQSELGNTAVFGFGNLFQMWNVLNWNTTPENIENSIGGWINNIKLAAQNGTVNSLPFDPDKKIEGFCNYSLSADDGMFYMVKEDESHSGIQKAGMLRDNYQLDNIGPETAGLSHWSEFWNSLLSGGWNGTYCSGVPDALNNKLKPGLLGLANIFLERSTYAGQDLSEPVKVSHKSGRVFKSLKDSLDLLRDTMASSKYIVTPLPGKGNLSDPAAYPSLNPADPSDPAHGKYFLVINDNPEEDLTLDGTAFNGVIFTTGRVILKNGAKVNGAIIAAGRGYDPDSSNGYISGSAAKTEVIGGAAFATGAPTIKEDGSNLYVLDGGGYAGVYCRGGAAAVNFPYEGSLLSPEEGREWLLEQFKTQDPEDSLDLHTIF